MQYLRTCDFNPKIHWAAFTDLQISGATSKHPVKHNSFTKLPHLTLCYLGPCCETGHSQHFYRELHVLTFTSSFEAAEGQVQVNEFTSHCIMGRHMCQNCFL